MTLEPLYRKVMELEGLSDWTLKINNTGGLCQSKCKRIICDDNDFALFLHEVAHALTRPELYPKWETKDKTGHHSFWADVYTELIRKYLCPSAKSTNTSNVYWEHIKK